MAVGDAHLWDGGTRTVPLSVDVFTNFYRHDGCERRPAGFRSVGERVEPSPGATPSGRD
ncbi:MAG: hypothetical protein H0V32_02610 [Nocardioidaceae bacterium]|nr:hypothetical protein [Nocardioidaceae bacterium]